MATEIANTLRKRLAAEVPGAMVSVFDPVPIRGAGRTGGFKRMVEDRRDLGLLDCQTAERQPVRDKATGIARKNAAAAGLPT